MIEKPYQIPALVITTVEEVGGTSSSSTAAVGGADNSTTAVPAPAPFPGSVIYSANSIANAGKALTTSSPFVNSLVLSVFLVAKVLMKEA